MVIGFSVVVSFFTIKTVIAIVIALAIANSAPGDTASIPGRKIINIPTKPKNIAIILL